MKINKWHIISLIVMLGMVILRFWDFFSLVNMHLGDSIASTQMLNYVRQSFLEYGQFPLWYPNEQAGTPFFGHPIYPVISYTTLIALLVDSPQGMFNYSQLLGIFLSGVMMYILMIQLKLRPIFALVSSLYYMISPFIIAMIGTTTEIISGYVYVPVFFLFFWKAMNTKRWATYSALAGLILGLQFLGNGFDVFLFMVIIVIATVFVHLIGGKVGARFTKALAVCATLFIIFVGIFSVKLLPMLEYNVHSSKQNVDVFSYAESLSGGRITGTTHGFSEIVQAVVFPWEASERRAVDNYYLKLGIPGILFFIYALFHWRKKIVLTLGSIAALTVLIAWPTHIWWFFWKFMPVFDRLHHLDRSMYIYSFATAALIGLGASYLYDKYGSKVKIKHWILGLLLIGLVFVDLTVLSGPVSGGRINVDRGLLYQQCLDDVELLSYIQEQEGIFRTDNIGTLGHAGHAPSVISVMNITMLFGGTGTWFPEFYDFTSNAGADVAKFMGLMNVRYVYSDQELGVEGLNFVQQFSNPQSCKDYESYPTDRGLDGPYLYENEKMLPRYYSVDHGILVIGDKGSVDPASYAIMSFREFDSSSIALVMHYGNLDDFDIETLAQFDLIVMGANSVEQRHAPLLQQYHDRGGKMLPNIIEGRQQIIDGETEPILDEMRSGHLEHKPRVYTPNKVVFNFEETDKFLIATEKFFMFEGWEPTIGGKKFNVLRANGMNSVVMPRGQTGEVVFHYRPRSFQLGLLISLCTLLVVILIVFNQKLFKLLQRSGN